jgi:hypothetical protein
MTQLRTLRAALLAAPLFGANLFAVPANAQTDQAASLLDALSLISGRMLVPPMAAPEVTHDGDQFHVHIPLPKLTLPPNAAIEVTATALPSGVWDITGLALPPAGSLTVPATDGKPPGSLRYTIGQQTMHGRTDPTLAVPSPYAMAFSDLAFHVDNPESPADLSVAQLTNDGTITGDGGGRMTTRSHTRADGWHVAVTTKTGAPFIATLRSFDAVSGIDGLDRARAERLREIFKTAVVIEKATPPEAGEPQPHPQPHPMTPATRERLLTMLDLSTGLLSGMKVEETLQGLHFHAADNNSGDIGEMRFAMAGEVKDDKIAAHLDMGLKDMRFTAVPPQFVQYVPRRVTIDTAISGIPADALRHVLREALEESADPVTLRTEAIALLNIPGAHVGIDTLLVESGPLLLQGTARVMALPDGTAGVEIHLTAHGMDAMLALIAADPKAQQIMPMLFMAKGLGKPEGDNLVWNIGFAHGVATVNGVPMGQRPKGGEPGVRPPMNR